MLFTKECMQKKNKERGLVLMALLGGVYASISGAESDQPHKRKNQNIAVG